MVASWQRSVGTVTKEDESSTGCVWAAGFHHVMTCSHLAHVLKLMNRLFLLFPKFFSRRDKLWINESADTGVRLCVCVCERACVAPPPHFTVNLVG